MTLAMIALIESCDSAGTVGPPPVMADMVTENEARQIINRVFESNNVHLQEDIRFILRLSQNDSTELNLDGFNDTLQVGYEYLSSADWGSPVHLAWRTLDSLTQEAGPYIKVMDEKTKYPNYQLFMEGVVQEFIDTLKARGVI
ncbi:MAG: hypothetical protein GTO29_15380 [Candidatus Latescibacteria bacterium]|nr:hypothetical protein [Candidatus Latescibacterota bacterium]